MIGIFGEITYKLYLIELQKFTVAPFTFGAITVDTLCKFVDNLVLTKNIKY